MFPPKLQELNPFLAANPFIQLLTLEVGVGVDHKDLSLSQVYNQERVMMARLRYLVNI